MISGSSRNSENWDAVGEYLADSNVRLLSGDDREKLLAEWQDIARLEKSIDDAILVGLVGGTGVGKSTFINALAGEVVSRSGDRRPTSDSVVVYRYVDTELPDDVPQDDFAKPQVLHRRESLDKVIVFDFPDFDSAERKHAHIIQRYLDYLDILLIVVDDMKYADRRLYELLVSLGQSADNLFVLLNKVDRLENRYGDQTDKVVDELVGDIQVKMEENANLDLRKDQLFPISAGEVLKARCEEQPSDMLPGFAKVETLLQGFQEGKYHRQIKEQNIDSRKVRLSQSIASTALGEENRSILEETGQLVTNWKSDLDSALLAIPEDLLMERERKGIRKSRVRRSSRDWGMPFSIIFTLMGELPWSKGGESVLNQAEMESRVHHHYRGFFEAARNLQARFQSEFAGSKIANANLMDADTGTDPGDSSEQWSARMATQAIAQIQSQERPGKKWTRFLWHLPAIGTLVMAIWSRIDPVMNAVGGEGNFFVAIARAFFGTMNPMFVFGLILMVIIAYLLTAFVLWVRETQVLDGYIADAEKVIRDDVRAKGQSIVEKLSANVDSLSSEYSSLEKLLEK